MAKIRMSIGDISSSLDLENVVKVVERCEKKYINLLSEEIEVGKWKIFKYKTTIEEYIRSESPFRILWKSEALSYMWENDLLSENEFYLLRAVRERDSFCPMSLVRALLYTKYNSQHAHVTLTSEEWEELMFINILSEELEE